MRKVLGAILLALLCSTAAFAQLNVCPGPPKEVYALDDSYEAVTISTVAIGLTVPQGAEMAYGVVEDNNVRYRDDGGTVTASNGVLIVAGTPILVCAGSMEKVRFIRESADAVLKITYYGRR